MSKLIVANWKLNPQTLSSAVRLARQTDRKGVVLCPPHTYLEVVSRAIHNATLGAQDAFWEKKGSYTGGVSISQLKHLKVKYVILGHSSRREHLDETDEIINRKVRTVLDAGLKAVLCIGENLDVHKKGTVQTKNFVRNQLKRDLGKIPRARLKNLIVAYEPIWSISTSGSGLEDTPEEAEKIIKYIKELLRKTHKIGGVKVLYGGSVDKSDAREYMSQKSIDGVLVGRESLDSKEFQEIVKAGK